MEPACAAVLTFSAPEGFIINLAPEHCGLANSALGNSSLKNSPKGWFSCLLPNASGSNNPIAQCVQC